MPARARYDGPYPEVRVAVANQGDVYAEKYVLVKRGGLLPEKQDDGSAVPAAVRNDLIANHPDFSEVKTAPRKPRKPKAPKAPAAPPPPDNSTTGDADAAPKDGDQ